MLQNCARAQHLGPCSSSNLLETPIFPNVNKELEAQAGWVWARKSDAARGSNTRGLARLPAYCALGEGLEGGDEGVDVGGGDGERGQKAQDVVVAGVGDDVALH